jgi:AraC family transcriptional regulator
MTVQSPERDFLADVLAYIETHLFEPMTLADLAAIAELSPYHFCRLFTARLGNSVMDHVRARRLEAAYMRLSGSSPPELIDLAFDCGFESQEAFTRAFRRRYGIAPGQFKRASQPRRIEMMNEVVTANVKHLSSVKRGAFTVAGPRAAFDDENKSGIPALWPRLIRCLPLEGQAAVNTYGVCWAGDLKKGSINYMAGVEVKGDARLPDGFERIDIAPQTYAVFRVTLDGGNLHQQIQAAMPVIWGNLLPKSGLKFVPAPDLEVYPAEFNPEVKGMYVDFYIPVEA